MNWVCRFVLLTLFAVFWGGLTFYAGIVVRISHDVLPDPMDGGMITQRATGWLQIIGALTVAAMLCNAILEWRCSKWFGIALTICAVLLGCVVAGLFAVHFQLDAVIDVDAVEIVDRSIFTINHRRYNQLTTATWLLSLAYLGITVAAWGRPAGTISDNSATQ